MMDMCTEILATLGIILKLVRKSIKSVRRILKVERYATVLTKTGLNILRMMYCLNKSTKWTIIRYLL